MADVIFAQQGDTLDALLWRERGLSATDAVAVLEANPGLADRGVVLPLGTPVDVSTIAAPAPRTLPLVQLWD